MKKQKAFTLIEVLIVVAIMIIMLGIVLSMSRNDRDRQFMRANVDLFTAAIREAQNSSLTGDLINGERPCSFTVNVTNATYEVEAITYNSSVLTEGCDAINRTRNLVPLTTFSGGVKVKVSDPAFPDFLKFGNQFGDVVIGTADTADFAKYVLQNASLDYTVCVFRSGRVEARGFGDLAC